MSKRDFKKGALPFQFVVLPRAVLESPEYRALPDSARSLLNDLLMQYTGKNNGRLSPSIIVMRRYGWTSSSKLVRAKSALLTCPWVLVTRKGKPPQTAEWVGVTWFKLDYDRDMDVDQKKWPYLNFLTIQACSIDPNQGREKQFLLSRIRTKEKVSPREPLSRIGTDEPAETSPICSESGQGAIGDCSKSNQSRIRTSYRSSHLRARACEAQVPGEGVPAPTEPDDGNTWTARLIRPMPAEILALKPPTAAGLRAVLGNQLCPAAPPSAMSHGTDADGAGQMATTASSIVARHWLQEVAA